MLQPLFPSSNVSGSHPDGRYVQNEYGDIPLHFASPLHRMLSRCPSQWQCRCNDNARLKRRNCVALEYRKKRIGPAVLWELLCYNRECVIIPGFRGVTALQLLEFYEEHFETITTQMNAKAVILKMAQYYNHLPKLPNDAMIEVVEFHPACTVLARRLELGNNDFIIHEALEANYPTVLVEALVYIFPQQVEQQASFAITHCSASWSWCFRSSTRC